jgi:DNA primase
MAKSYSEDQIQQVLENNNIVDVVSQYVTLKKSGHQYTGRCPFHHEKTPSFSVSAEKQLYYCFGCGAGGDMITFVRNIENLSFAEGVKYLADRANIVLPESEGYNDDESKKREALYRMHKDAARFFYKNRAHSRKTQDYLRSRGIEEETARQFALGYAGVENSALYDFLKSKGYKDEDIKDSGLTLPGQGRGGSRDRFRDRLMFPIVSVAKNVTGFGGRLMEKNDKLPKYLNTSETMIFHKGSQLYGLNLAKTNLVNGQLIAVEGYMDVISLYQSGIRNVVASLGTALTEGQGRLMKRYVEEVVLCYDGDAAGVRAALRGIQVLESLDLRVKVMKLKNNMDPDDFVRSEGKDAFVEMVDQAMSTVDFRIGLLRDTMDLNRNDEKIRFVTEAARILKEIKNPIEQEMQIHQFAQNMHIDPGVLFKEMKKEEIPAAVTVETQGSKDNAKVRRNVGKEAQEMLIGWLFTHLETGRTIAARLRPEHFQKGLYRDAAIHAFHHLEEGRLPNPSAYVGSLEEDAHQRLLSRACLDVENPTEESLEDCIRTLEVKYIKRYIAFLQKQMADFNLTDEAVNQLYCDMVEKKKELEQMQSMGREHV